MIAGHMKEEEEVAVEGNEEVVHVMGRRVVRNRMEGKEVISVE